MSAADLETRRLTFLEAFPPDRLPTLTVDDLMQFVHGDAPKTGLFYELEFGALGDGFGSIAGGSSLKFKVYRASDGTGYRKKQPGSNASMPCSDAEAETLDLFHKCRIV